MFWTSRMGVGSVFTFNSHPALAPLLPQGEKGFSSLVVAGLGALGPAGVLLGVGLGGLVEKRVHLGRVRADEIADLYPFRPAPLLDEGGGVAVVVGAGRFQRHGEVFESERL